MTTHSGSSKNWTQKQMDDKALLDMFDEGHSDLVELAKLIGLDGMRAVMQVYAGQKPHIPQYDNFINGLQRTARNNEMCNRFTGDNHGQLALEYKLDESQVRRIVNHEGKTKMRTVPKAVIKASPDTRSYIMGLAKKHDVTTCEITDALIDIAANTTDVDAMVRYRVKQQLSFAVSA